MSSSQDKLAAVRQKFRQSLAAKAMQLESLINTKDYKESFQTNTLVIDLVHKIAGSAGFYGEDDIARHAGNLEQQLKRSENQWEQFDELTTLVTMLRSRANSEA